MKDRVLIWRQQSVSKRYGFGLPVLLPDHYRACELVVPALFAPVKGHPEEPKQQGVVLPNF